MRSSSYSVSKRFNESASRRCWSLLLGPVMVFALGCDRAMEPGQGDLAMEAGTEMSSSEGVSEGDGQAEGTVAKSDSVPMTPLQPPVPAKTAEADPDLPELAPPPSSLEIGDPNPGIHLAKLVKGSPVEAPLEGKVHVVEFWATWCGPCRTGMPHISALQEEYGDKVQFIGVTRENESTVTGFLAAPARGEETWDEVIQYTLAIDDRDWTNKAYMKAAGQNGIPCAFVVGKDGVIEWIGHPASIDEPLKQIVAGDWDREAAIAQYQADKILKQAMSEISGHMRKGDWDAALGTIDKLEEEVGETSSLLRYRYAILQSAGRTEEANAALAKLVDSSWDDPQMLNMVAWNTANAGQGAELELALKAGLRATELTEDKNGAILDTVARCYYALGNLDEAIAWQKKAVANGDGDSRMNATLRKYEQEKSASEEKASEDDDANEEGATPESDGDDVDSDEGESDEGVETTEE